MSFRHHWKRYGKCIAGSLGGTGLGVIGGVAVGSFIPVLGTIGCGVLGGVSGFLSGAASSCGGGDK